MSSIRLRLFLLISFFFGTTAWMGWTSYDSFRLQSEARRQLETSFAVTEAIRDPAQLKNTPELLRRVQPLRAKLKPERRAEELGLLIEAVRHSAPLRDRPAVLLKNEAAFQRYTRDQIEYLERRLLYYGSLALLSMLVGFVGLQIFASRAIVRPMRDLSRKMVDFLHDRYTYQFSVPSNDEIGHMQATFNSLAQRVIGNMEQLRTLDQAKSEFLSIASHELRTPLTSIKGSLSLMRSGVVGEMNEMADNLLTIAENETDRLIRLINDLLDLAKIEAGKLPLHQDWHSLNDLARVCLESLEGLAQQAGVELECVEMPPLDVYMDADRIQQVITNLMSNAIKFSPKGETVTLSCQVTDDQQLLIEVRDRGRGIAPEDQGALFQKFRQATNARNPLVKGTGLGLAIAKALVDQHGGEVGLRSTPGEGSTFYFTLPEWRPGTARVSADEESAGAMAA